MGLSGVLPNAVLSVDDCLSFYVCYFGLSFDGFACTILTGYLSSKLYDV